MTIQTETTTAWRTTRVAEAYARAQCVLSGQTHPYVHDRQWQACWAVAERFLSEPGTMTLQLCHHVWRMAQMQHSHPDHWPEAAIYDWHDLDPTNQYCERAGLAAMREALHAIEWEEAEALTEHLHPDAQQLQGRELSND